MLSTRGRATFVEHDPKGTHRISASPTTGIRNTWVLNTLPRTTMNSKFYSKVFSNKGRLIKLETDEGVAFPNAWDIFSRLLSVTVQAAERPVLSYSQWLHTSSSNRQPITNHVNAWTDDTTPPSPPRHVMDTHITISISYINARSLTLTSMSHEPIHYAMIIITETWINNHLLSQFDIPRHEMFHNKA